MGQQIKFYKKNKIDLSLADPTITVTDATATDRGQDYVNYLRDRKNTTGWFTTGSNDAANTEILIDLVDIKAIDAILIVGHNLKAFTVQYYDEIGLSYVAFSTPISETNNTATTNEFTFDSVSTSKVKITITGTQTTNDDKQIKQIILTERIGSGQFEGWPIVKPQVSLNRKVSTTPSGKVSVVESLGTYSVTLSVMSWKSDNDLSIVESIYFTSQPFLVWPCGGDETQFSTVRRGYRLEDIYLMKCIDEYRPEYYKGNYFMGLNISIKLAESI